MPSLFVVVCKELRELTRDRVAVAVCAVFFGVLLASCVASARHWTARDAAQRERQTSSREDWLGQSSTSAHDATHRGMTVYRRPSPLAAVDPGTDPVLGSAVRLESHRRNEPTGVPGRDRLRLLRLNFGTPAELIQAVLPLVAVLLSYATVARERERGTWGFLQSLGVGRSAVVLGKLTATFAAVAVLTGPVVGMLLWTLATAADEAVLTWGELAVRGAALYATTLLYLFGWCVTGVALSTRFSAGATLVLLITAWAGATLVVPRVAVDLAYSQHPTPAPAEFRQAREAAVRHGSDGDRSLEEFRAEVEGRLLRQYGVDEVADLPVDLDAAGLLAMEAFTDALDDTAQARVDAVHEEQTRFVERSAALSPFLAVRSLSTALAGTDRVHHAAFLRSAERHRRSYVAFLNTAQLNREGPGDTAASARAFWGRVPEFRQRVPSLRQLAGAARWPVGLLLGWSAAILAVALRRPRGAGA
ncbi:DUF3526 domain-containing protein [Alienimonas californiensis]|uniref:ABC-2 family transporter protein n=1 Tax=Alienimonas californiensis TaxID=2527989 RepID=A0A517P5T3_9PLAN|nr:DUF3526 domain-containing protein [Alienimonas californiensis]QDT14739.1 ABC-2 family transporter protein [Alienimonas californiensis]